ncbi:MAG: hypothetical protein ACJ78Q_17125 [Chloroflexia bacterium]
MGTKPLRLPRLLFLVLLASLLVSSLQPFQMAGAADQLPRILPPLSRGTPNDQWADVIIGKPNFSDIGPYTTSGSKLFWPHGTIVDRTDPADNKLYIYDAGNNRILGFHLAKCLAGPTNPANCTADLVIGQPTMTGAGCNGDSGYQGYPNRIPASGSSLCGQPETTLSVTETGSGSSMAVDSQGNLYVTDFWNHRVLRYNAPFSNDTAADEVWGQDNFQANACNKSLPFPDSRIAMVVDASTICFSWGRTNAWTAGVDVDAEGNVWVADSGNNRVLRFPPGSHAADLAIGQSDLTARIEGADANRLRTPVAVRMSPTGRLYVADQGNNRVMVFEPPFATNMAGRVFGSGFNNPSAIDFDPTQPGVWIMNSTLNSLERWDEASGLLVEVVGRKGQGNLLDRATGSIGIDSSGNKYMAVGVGDYQNDVLMLAPGATTMPTRRLFGGGAGNEATGAGIATGGGVAVADNQLLVADRGRILYWDNPSQLTNGQVATGAAGGATSLTDVKRGCCLTLKADRAHHLWVSAPREGSLPNRINAYALPLNPGAQPVLTLTFPLNVLGGGQLSDNGIYQPFWGIAPTDNSEFLWVSHSSTNRVFRVRDPLSNPVVDVILGQPDIGSTACNRGGSPRVGMTSGTLCLPGSVSLDRQGNLYVSDHSLEIQGNMRLLVFSKNLFPAYPSRVIFAPDATKIFPNIATWEPAFDSQNHMVVGYNPYWTPNPGDHGRFPGIYNDPLSSSTAPDGFLNDYYSMAISATFDDDDNLYIGDGDRSRVLIYERPTINGSAPPPPTDKAPTYKPKGSGSRNQSVH